MITLLFDIADDLADDGIVFDIYGQRDEKYCKEINFNLKIKNSLNVNYHGEYKGFDALPIHDYDIMIMPSLFEGLPNVLLEAIKANLFVVAADVGGVSEVLNDKSNGFLITDNTSKQQYVEKIYEYYSSKVLQDGVRRKKINKIILANRTHQSYKDNVNKIYGL